MAEWESGALGRKMGQDQEPQRGLGFVERIRLDPAEEGFKATRENGTMGRR